MRRKALLAGLAAVVASFGMSVPAQADTAQSTLSVSVNMSTTITFSDATAAFGFVNAGTTTEQLGTLTYTYSTSGVNGATVIVQTANAAGGGPGVVGPIFSIRQTAGGTYTGHALPDTSGTLISATAANGGWTHTTTAGTASNIQDDVQVVVGPAVPTGVAFQRLLDYIVTAN
jgi:hypothetical protein